MIEQLFGYLVTVHIISGLFSSDFLKIKFAKVRVESANCKLQTYVHISKFGPFRPKLPPNFPQKLSEVRGGMWGRKISGEEVGNRGKREEEGK